MAELHGEARVFWVPSMDVVEVVNADLVVLHDDDGTMTVLEPIGTLDMQRINPADDEGQHA